LTRINQASEMPDIVLRARIAGDFQGRAGVGLDQNLPSIQTGMADAYPPYPHLGIADRSMHRMMKSTRRNSMFNVGATRRAVNACRAAFRPSPAARSGRRSVRH